MEGGTGLQAGIGVGKEDAFLRPDHRPGPYMCVLNVALGDKVRG